MFFIHSSTDGNLGCCHFLVIVNDAVMHMECRCLFNTMISVPLDEYPEVELLDLIVVLYLIFRGTSILLVIMAVLIYISIRGVQGFACLHIFTNKTLIF